jgi:hypothetical protein
MKRPKARTGSGIGGKQLSAAINMQAITQLTRLRPFARILPDEAEYPIHFTLDRAPEETQPWRRGLGSIAEYSAS